MSADHNRQRMNEIRFLALVFTGGLFLTIGFMWGSTCRPAGQSSPAMPTSTPPGPSSTTGAQTPSPGRQVPPMTSGTMIAEMNRNCPNCGLAFSIIPLATIGPSQQSGTQATSTIWSIVPKTTGTETTQINWQPGKEDLVFPYGRIPWRTEWWERPWEHPGWDEPPQPRLRLRKP